MEQLISYQEHFAKIIHEAREAKDTKETVDILTKSFSELKKIFAKIDVEKKKEAKLEFSIISQPIIDDLESFQTRIGLKFEINYELAKLANLLFSIPYFDYLCTDDKQVIYFLNFILNIIETIRGNLIYQLIIRKAHMYMNYTFQK